ncbi:hypothetical protein ACO2Q9_05635 [Variovorax sp. VNK109]|uniref:hypothetical protein n=1 Tax=Variovorax sp. VNK109 TaxID=3400919 RepID=UPI003C0C6E32
MKPALAAAVTCVALLAPGLSAQAMSIRELRTIEQTEQAGSAYIQYYLIGVMEGLREANDLTVREGHKPWFCVQGRKLEPRMAFSLYDAELKRNSDLYEADMPVQLVLSNALRNAYRCP